MRLTDADALLVEYDRVHVGPPGKARQLILDAPTIAPGPQWIPCCVRLPDEHGHYLGYVINDPWRYAITVTFFPANSFYPGSEPSWTHDSETASNNVVAWMPLPEPYREDKPQNNEELITEDGPAIDGGTVVDFTAALIKTFADDGDIDECPSRHEIRRVIKETAKRFIEEYGE